MQPDQIVAQLLARGDINEDTATDLARMLADYQGGRLDPDDEAYLRALHARLTGTPAEEPIAAAPSTADRLEGLSLAEWRERALAAEAALAALEDATRVR